jgi:hypothetical protein
MLLLAISIISITPPLIRADQQSLTVPVTINASGQATAIANSTTVPTTLNLTGTSYRNSNQWLIIQNTTGTLEIGQSTFDIVDGQGSVNNLGDIAIFASTPSGVGQLILHGTINGTGVNFDSPQSQLAAIAYLSLSGTIDQNIHETANPLLNSPTNSTTLASKTTISIASLTNETQSSSTAIPSSTTSVSQETAQINIQNVTTYTINSTMATALTTSSITNTTTLSGGGNASYNPSTPGNITVTVTQYVNQTISTTQTVANATISYTVTTTIANTTITQSNVTTTVTATTGT